jgi:hypothetical protein
MYMRVVSLPLLITRVCYMHGYVLHLHIHIHIHSHIDNLVILNHRLCFKLKLTGFHFLSHYEYHNSVLCKTQFCLC